MRVRRSIAPALLLAGAGLTGCTTDHDAATAAAPTTPSETPVPSGPTRPPDEAAIPVTADRADRPGGLPPMADGTVDPELTARVSPALLARVQEELARPPGTLPSHLPEDDGNGYDLAAAVRSGCDGSAPLRYGTVPGGPSVGVDRSGDQPRLVLVASAAMDVAFGDTRVGDTRDWVFTSAPTAGGWQLTDATAESAVDWFPVP